MKMFNLSAMSDSQILFCQHEEGPGGVRESHLASRQPVPLVQGHQTTLEKHGQFNITVASQVLQNTGNSIVCSSVGLDRHQRKHQISTSLILCEALTQLLIHWTCHSGIHVSENISSCVSTLFLVQYGYRLPDEEGEVLYYQVYFKPIGEILFTYPEYCLRPNGLFVLPRVDPRPIVQAFLGDLASRLPSVCGRKLNFRPNEPRYLEVGLNPMTQVRAQTDKFFIL